MCMQQHGILGNPSVPVFFAFRNASWMTSAHRRAGQRPTREELPHDLLVPVVQHVREEMHVMTVGQGTARHVAGDDIHAAGEPARSIARAAIRSTGGFSSTDARSAGKRAAIAHAKTPEPPAISSSRLMQREIEIRRECRPVNSPRQSIAAVNSAANASASIARCQSPSSGRPAKLAG